MHEFLAGEMFALVFCGFVAPVDACIINKCLTIGHAMCHVTRHVPAAFALRRSLANTVAMQGTFMPAQTMLVFQVWA